MFLSLMDFSPGFLPHLTTRGKSFLSQTTPAKSMQVCVAKLIRLSVDDVRITVRSIFRANIASSLLKRSGKELVLIAEPKAMDSVMFNVKKLKSLTQTSPLNQNDSV
ncbi:hypothetical protein [Klebsiella aerogenes]|uniref:hypothetical protein n=1 Tax=Klebsiella aerogenes TaxID=548 RepID=UPI001C70BE06|nr:hypothetical protein [Klebsiella aerogenes]